MFKGSFLRASDGEFVEKIFPIREDLVAIPSGTLVLNSYMRREDYRSVVKGYGTLTPGDQKLFASLGNAYVHDAAAFKDKMDKTSDDFRKNVREAGLGFDYTSMRAIDDHVNNRGRYFNQKVVNLGPVKLPEDLCSFDKLSTLLGGFNTFEVPRMRYAFEGTAKDVGEKLEASHIAARLTRATKMTEPAATRAATSYMQNRTLIPTA